MLHSAQSKKNYLDETSGFGPIDLIGTKLKEAHVEILKFKVTGPIPRRSLVTKFITKIVQGDLSPCAKPPVDSKSKVPLWPGQAGAG